ncbi:MAG: glycosyltransferase family 39 protein [Armatimonadota bacterium]|nr:glycosyltransferase family 39 protein [Armatimonadota bacterium]
MSSPILQKTAISEARRYGRAAGLFLFLLTVFRFWYVGQHELLQDESYYWQWARHLDWGYYDNTPLAALVIRAFITLLGSNETGVRAGAIVSALVASLFIYLLTARLLGPKIALFAVVLANVVPLFAAGAVIMTQDPVQLALWAAALYVVQRSLTDKPHWWYGAGVLAGLAALAKLNALLLLPGVFLYLLLSPTARERWLKRPEPYLAGLIALLIFSPFVWWNHTHQNAFWIHIHAMGSRSSEHDPPLKWTLRFLGDQALVLSPFVFLTYLYTLYDGWRRGAKQHDDAVLFLWCPSVVVFVATLCVSLRSKIEANWAVAAYITGLILVAAVLVRAWQARRRVWPGVCLGFAGLMAAVALFPGLLYGLGVKFHKPSQDRTNELYGWRTLATRVAQEEAIVGGNPFVFGTNYRMPSEAAFYLTGQPQTYSLFLHDRYNEYMFWENPQRLVGRNAVYISDEDSLSSDQVSDLKAVFTRVEPQSPVVIYRNPPYAKPIRTVQIVRCYGFKGYDAPQWQVGW